MSKTSVVVSLAEMYAIKHALQKQVKEKNERLEEICTNEVANWDDELEAEFKKLDKDIEHEKALIQKIEREITDFRDKNNIH